MAFLAGQGVSATAIAAEYETNSPRVRAMLGRHELNVLHSARSQVVIPIRLRGLVHKKLVAAANAHETGVYELIIGILDELDAEDIATIVDRVATG